MNKYIYLSLLGNIILLFSYFHFFHFRKSIQDYKPIYLSLDYNAELFDKDTAILEYISKITNKKPEAKKILMPYLLKGASKKEAILNQFDRIINTPKPSKIQLKNQVENYNLWIIDMQDLYENTIRDVQKEAKLRDEEVEQKIKNCNVNSQIFQVKENSIKNLNKKEKLLFLKSLKAQVNRLYNFYTGDIGGMIGGRCCFCMTHYYPMVFPKKEVLQEGEKYECDIVLNKSDPYGEIKQCQIFWDGKQLDYNPYEGEIEIKQKITQKPYQKQQAIVRWKDDNNQTQSDTTYFQFYIN